MKKQNKARVALWFALILIVLLVVLLSVKRKPDEKVAETPEQATPVDVISLQPSDYAETIILPGLIQPYRDIYLGAEKAGRVTELLVERGDRVQRDQKLLQINDAAWQTVLRTAELERENARKELERWKALKKTGAVSASDYDKVEQRYLVAEARHLEVSEYVKQLVVRSPGNGMIDDRMAEEGAFLKEGSVVFRYVEMDPVKLLIDLPERDVFSLKNGDLISFTVQSIPGRTFEGRVTFIASVGEKASNSFAIEALVPNEQELLKGGMLADVSLVRQRRENVLKVPLEAVIPKQGEYVIFVLEEGRAVRKVVQMEAIVGHEAVISEGLKAGENVVVSGQRTLVDGALVQTATP